jgi:natural product biosynthesis luciferase-like monooxygenase protein
MTSAVQAEEAARFRVLANQTGRHALWPACKAIPAGWKEVLTPAPREECLEFVRRVSAEPSRDRQEPACVPLPGGRGSVQTPQTTPKLGFGFLFFGGDEGSSAWEKYEFVINVARFADQAGFDAVWLPERHFTAMGSLYPNPAVLHAALARETRRIRLRAGSVVMPLNDPIRVAEEWALVDNLSHGRVEVSFAPGWNVEDFALRPDHYPRRYELMYEGIKVVKQLWSGQPLDATDGTGKKIRIRTYPTPIQKHLTIWITAAGSPQSFQQAGQIGANLLTHLFDQGVEELAEKIALYRKARADHGFDPAAGRVAVALHTYLAEDFEEVRRNARQPYLAYLKGNLKLLEKLAQNKNIPIDVTRLTPAQLDQALEWVFEKFVQQRSLLGTPTSCLELVSRLAEAGVQEIACLLDFGPACDAILASLPKLRELMERFHALASN